MAIEISDADIDNVRLTEQGADAATPAAGFWRIFAKANGLYVIEDNGAVVGPLTVDKAIVEGRLTLETGVPISTADQSAKATLYFTPYKGNRIGLYNGTDGWDVLEFTEKSLSLVGYTADRVYDIWAYNNGGVVALESTIWTDATNRATALTTQDGIYVKTGATTRRYIGTICINSTGGQTEDTDLQRYVWNFYNQELRKLFDTYAASHTYVTASWRAWNNSTTLGNGRVEFVMGLDRYMSLGCQGRVQNVSGAGIFTGAIGAGLNTTTSAHASPAALVMVANQWAIQSATAIGQSAAVAGFNYMNAVEIGDATSLTYLEIRIWGTLLG